MVPRSAPAPSSRRTLAHLRRGCGRCFAGLRHRHPEDGGPIWSGKNSAMPSKKTLAARLYIWERNKSHRPSWGTPHKDISGTVRERGKGAGRERLKPQPPIQNHHAELCRESSRIQAQPMEAFQARPKPLNPFNWPHPQVNMRPTCRPELGRLLRVTGARLSNTKPGATPGQTHSRHSKDIYKPSNAGKINKCQSVF